MNFWKSINQWGAIGVACLLLVFGCADYNAVRTALADSGDERVGLNLSEIDVDIRDARQDEELENLYFTIRVEADSDRCDLVDTEVRVELRRALTDTVRPGAKLGEFTYALGRVKRGHDKSLEVVESTDGLPIMLNSIHPTNITARVQNCTLDPFVQ